MESIKGSESHKDRIAANMKKRVKLLQEIGNGKNKHMKGQGLAKEIL